MQITTNCECSVMLSRMPIVQELGMTSCWIIGEGLHREDAPDVLLLEVVFDRERTLRLAYAMLSPEIRALQTTFPTSRPMRTREDQAGSTRR